MLKGNERINGGEVTLRKPNAGMKNKALMKAESVELINGVPHTIIRQSVFMVEMLPLCVQAHPWGTTPIRQALDLLDIDEYETLVSNLQEMLEESRQIKKNSQPQSDLSEEKTSGLSE